MKRVAKFQEGGTARSGISNEPVGSALRRLFRRSEPMQGPPAPSSSGQRPQEDRARMAEEAAAEFDREEAALAERARQRRNRPSAITNQPVGERLAGRRAAPAPAPQASGRSYSTGEGGTLQPESTQRPPAPPRSAAPRPAARESMSADDLNEIVLRLNRGEKPVTETEKRLADRMGIAYRKGGMVKPKTAMKKGGAVKAPAKKMKSGGKVAPKKRMKGGMTSKPKKMMGGGRAMYAKGGMARGCK